MLGLEFVFYILVLFWQCCQTHMMFLSFPLFLQRPSLCPNILLFSCNLLLHQLDLSQTAVYLGSIADILTYWSSALGALFQFDGHFHLIFLLCLVHLHVLVHGSAFNDMSTILQLNKSCLWVILKAKEDLSYFFMMTDAALVRALLSTQPDARMSTTQ